MKKEKKSVKKRDGKSARLQSTFLGKQIQARVLQAASSEQSNDSKKTESRLKEQGDTHTPTHTRAVLRLSLEGKLPRLAMCFHCCVFC